MVLYVMLFGLGFLTAAGLSAAAAPLVWRQAQEIAHRRALATLPMRMSDIVAARDQVRAAFIIEMRRQESELDRLRRLLGETRIDIGRKIEVAAAYAARFEVAAAAAAKLEGEKTALIADVEAGRVKLAETEAARVAVEEDALEKDDQIARLKISVADVTVTSDSRRVEIASLRTKVEGLRERIENLERDKRRLEGRLADFEAGVRTVEQKPRPAPKPVEERAGGAMRNRKEQELLQLLATVETLSIIRPPEQTLDVGRLTELAAAMQSRNQSVGGGDDLARRPKSSEVVAERLDAEVEELKFDPIPSAKRNPESADAGKESRELYEAL